MKKGITGPRLDFNNLNDKKNIDLEFIKELSSFILDSK
jgi:hypothetical protein